MVIDEAIVELYFMKLFSLSNAAHSQWASALEHAPVRVMDVMNQ